jgi:hypothetical protein
VSDPLGQIAEVLKNVLAAVGLGTSAVKGARLLFGYQRGDVAVCNTRVMHDGVGLPWNRQIAIHPLQDGRLEITSLAAPDEGPRDDELLDAGS